MSRILQSSSIVGQLVSRSFSRAAFSSTKYSLSSSVVAESCEINGKHVSSRSPVNKFKNGLTSSVQSSKFHTSSSAYSDESQQDEKSAVEVKSSRNEGNTGESVIDRLRRLSETPAEHYELSPMAQEKARQMADVRAEAIRSGDHWKWDQRNIRPGGPPQQGQNRNRGFNRYDRDRDDEDFGDYRGGGGGYGGGGGRQQGYNQNRGGFDRYNRDEDEFDSYDLEGQSSGRGRHTTQRQPQYNQQRQTRETRDWDDDQPQDYEQEMEKLRARLEKTRTEKSRLQTKKVAMPSSEDIDSDERSSGASKSNVLHQISSPPLQNSIREPQQSFRQIRPISHPGGEVYHNPDEDQWLALEDKVDVSIAGFDPDNFGTLTVGSTSVVVKDIVGAAIQKELNEDAKALSITNDEEEEEDDTRYIPPPKERWTTPKLVKKVRELVAENKIKEAVDTYLGALKQGGFDFEKDELRHHFHILINECAKVGYVEMAFKLFNLMKKRGYKGKDRTISCLLNACANSPWDKENNLDRIEKLLIDDRDKGFELNLISYTALIKAYGRLGETLMAFNVVDQMINESKIRPDTTVFNMLLQACITDKKNGFRYALVTWSKMHSMGLRPDIFSFNLLLRTVKDCAIEIKSIEGLGSQQQISAAHSIPLLPPVITEEDSNRILSLLCLENPSNEDTQVVLDNLGLPSIISAKAMTKALSLPENRLAVLGGLRGMVSKMARSRVGPNLKTLTELMSVTHPSEFIDILRLLKTYKIKPDESFFTVAISRCNHYKLYDSAKDMLKQMSLHNISPNIVTWGSLALGCVKWKDAKSLLEEMEDAKFTPNTEVMYSLLYSAVRNFDPKYVLHIMEETRKRNITLSDKYLMVLEKFYATTQRGLVGKEMGKAVEPKKLADVLEKNPEFPEHFSLFKMRYPVWLQCVDVKVTPENPWKNEFEKFKKYGRHSPPKEENKDGEDFFIESEKDDVSVKNK